MDPIGLLFALLGLWLLARRSSSGGNRRFITFYFLTSAAGALATAWSPDPPSVRAHPYYGNWSAMEGLIAAFAVLMPDAQIFLYFVPSRRSGCCRSRPASPSVHAHDGWQRTAAALRTRRRRALRWRRLARQHLPAAKVW